MEMIITTGALLLYDPQLSEFLRLKISINIQKIDFNVPQMAPFEHMEILVHPITWIVNESLSQGIFPDSYRKAIITPFTKRTKPSTRRIKKLDTVAKLELRF